METMSKELRTSVIPFLKSYKINDKNKFWMITKDTTIVLPNTNEYRNDTRLSEVINLVNKEFQTSRLMKSGSSLKPVFINTDEIEAGDIVVKLIDSIEQDEAYQIEINNDNAIVMAKNAEGVLDALRSLDQLLLNNKRLPLGIITDYPDLHERRLHLDMARKYFSKEWIIDHIQKLSKLKMNTLQLHFSENKGFRIECEFDPQIVSQDGFLKKIEIREILAEAKLYGIKIIPALDTPGHVEHILKFHPEFGQIDIYGEHSKVALDITNPDAIDYAKALYTEYMELFDGCEFFHIGGDEYLEFNREPFDSEYQPVLDEYAKTNFEENYSWKDVVARYINIIAEHVYAGGFRPRIWNDAIYFGEEDQAQVIEMFPAIGIDYWSHMPWLKKVSSLKTIMEKGHNEIYNVHSSFFYYVLRDDLPEDGRPMNSFDVFNQDKNIYENWTPGIFTGETIEDTNPVIQGACIAVWNDNPNIVDETTITKDIHHELIAFAAKTWDYRSEKQKSFEDFTKINLHL